MPERTEGAPPTNAAAIERFGAWTKTQGLSQSAAAKLVGCSSATLSQVLSGKYAGDVTRIAEMMGRALSRADRHARAPKKPEIAMSSVCVECLDTLRTAHDEGVMAVIMGLSGAGKTSAARFYLKAEPETILITLRPNGRKGTHGSGRFLLHRLADGLGVEHDECSSQAELIDDCGAALKGSGRLVIIDEIDYAAEDTLQCVRMIHDVAETGIVMLATPAFLEKLRSRRSSTIAQFVNRIAYRCIVGKLTDDDVELILPQGFDRATIAAARIGAQGVARRLVYGYLAAQRIAAENGGKVDAKVMGQAFQTLMEA